jgi:Ca2+-transporting ATPase
MDRDQVIQYLHTRVEGLTDSEANERLRIHGFNKLKVKKSISRATIFMNQLKEPLIIVLLVASTISAFVGELVDALIIIAIVTLSTIVGFIQEFKSEKAIEALRKMTAASCRVIRNNEETSIDVEELVPGDIILVSAGDKVPGDAYLIESQNLEIDQAALSGESAPVEKTTAVLPKDTSVVDRKNIIYTISTVTYGRGKAVVFSTAMDTELGKVASAVQEIIVQKTPFEIKIRHTVKILSIIMLAVVGIVTTIAFIRGFQLLEILVWGISLAVAAVPEALPAVITASLALGTHKMAKENAIVRRLPAVEALGSTTIICTDKTGTLTKGEMTVTVVYVYGKYARVSGLGYSLEGEVAINSNINKKDLALLAKGMALCNDATIHIKQEKISPMGDPTELALLVFAYKNKMIKDRLVIESPRVHEIPFTSERKIMTTVHKNLDETKLQAFTKGASEVILGHCNKIRVDSKLVSISDDIKNEIVAANNEMAKNGLRVLALAYRDLLPSSLPSENTEENLTFIGLVGIMDPPRNEAIEAIAQCKTSGINVIMITGDHELTAAAVAREIGIIDDEKDHDGSMISGQDLEIMDIRTLSDNIDHLKIYSRVLPEQKLKIVQALKNKGHIVAMTGDGINDAPALKAADIGIAMGITGSQVAKEAASMILADDNFATIVSAIKEGRRIFDNVKKYLVYLLSVNLSEIIILAFSIMLGWPLPLLAKHILYINLATDGSPAIALGLEPVEPDVMNRKPRNPNENIFFGIKKFLIPIPILLATISLVLFAYVLEDNGWNSDFAIAKGRTMVFGVIVFFELFFALSCRSFIHNITKLGLVSNKAMVYSLLGETSAILFIMNFPTMQVLFDFVPLEATDWALILSLALIGFVYSEIVKFFTYKRGRRPTIKQVN